MRNAMLALVLLVGCDPSDVVQGPDGGGDPEPDAVASSLCWERCANDGWLEPWPSASPDHVICHETDQTCDLVTCGSLMDEGGCGETELWCPPSYGGACWCNSADDSGAPDAWCLK